ncbi:MAG: hypothetical protein A4E45_01999 [Methanosaeta sp. PtaB.Bin039]|nr:MAG: hypothetical protein A4E45_01999 [Methanosaeta sp. PtaB.Bin039]OPY44308.1 MAG: hypothetical protein A4E47_01630 [Methanosaeta sp. PtaU1.Bin028]HOT06525.1 hypothetical protein [Methanotrichaceae archaeon]HQF15602.1 hypothetical protein [Methanotrichaceae archaeon]HQI90338.1 hypothetical protein [Methanotrichaceae archaeon]
MIIMAGVFGNTRRCVLASLALLLLTTGSMAAFQSYGPMVYSDGTEYEPGEFFAEMRFNEGRGGPWLEWQRHPEKFGLTSDTSKTYWGRTIFFGPSGSLWGEYWPWDIRQPVRRVTINPQGWTLLGYVSTDSGSITVTDPSTKRSGSVKVSPGRGSYPVYLTADSRGRLSGLYVDLKG